MWGVIDALLSILALSPALTLAVPPPQIGRGVVLLLVGAAVWVLVYRLAQRRGGPAAGDPTPCPQCGEMLPPFARFCRRCGRKVG